MEGYVSSADLRQTCVAVTFSFIATESMSASLCLKRVRLIFPLHFARNGDVAMHVWCNRIRLIFCSQLVSKDNGATKVATERVLDSVKTESHGAPCVSRKCFPCDICCLCSDVQEGITREGS